MLARSLMLGAARRPVFVSYASATATTNILTINKPADIVNGDMLVAIVNGTDGGGPATWTVPAGWTERLDQGVLPNLCVATKIAGASEGASYAFTNSEAFPTLAGQIIALRNVQYDTIGTAGTRTGAGDIAIPGITLAAEGIVIAAVASGLYTVTHSTPSGMTLTGRTSQNAYGDVSGFYEAVLAAGATGTRTTTVSASAADSAGVLVGFKIA